MKKITIDVEDQASHIVKSLKKGVLVTTKHGDKVNAMTIGWGLLGIEWSRPIFVALVREHRFTNEMLQASGEFTVCIPQGEFDRKALGICGSTTGRDFDKIAKAGLTLVAPEKVSSPAIKELPLTLECRVVYSQVMDPGALAPEYRDACYPQDVDGSYPMANKDFHTLYHGEILAAYLIENE